MVLFMGCSLCDSGWIVGAEAPWLSVAPDPITPVAEEFFYLAVGRWGCAAITTFLVFVVPELGQVVDVLLPVGDPYVTGVCLVGGATDSKLNHGFVPVVVVRGFSPLACSYHT